MSQSPEQIIKKLSVNTPRMRNTMAATMRSDDHNPISTGRSNQHLKWALMVQLNDFLPDHLRDKTERRYENSSIEELRNAVGRQRQLGLARSM